MKVYEEDLFYDALSYYKDCDFDPKKPLRIQYRCHPAADTGGVLRQFFTDLLTEITNSYFHDSYYKLPLYNIQIVSSNVFKYIGTIAFHRILHEGSSLGIFSPGVYSYLVADDIQATMGKITIDDCSDKANYVICELAIDKDSV